MSLFNYKTKTSQNFFAPQTNIQNQTFELRLRFSVVLLLTVSAELELHSYCVYVHVVFSYKPFRSRFLSTNGDSNIISQSNTGAQAQTTADLQLFYEGREILLTVTIGSKGPNISPVIIAESWGTSNNSVGAIFL